VRAAIIAFLVSTLLSFAALAASPHPFTFIMIDAKSIQALGAFPFDRAILAKAVDQAAAMKAQSVVLNFYLDKPKSAEGDRALANAMNKLRAVLVACVPTEAEKPGEPNPLPHRFALMRYGKSEPKAIGGNKGWIPLPDLCDRAADVAFSNVTDDVARIPMIEAYQGAYVKTFWAVCMELAFNDGALITPGRDFNINDRSLELDDHSIATIDFPKADNVETISFVDFLNGKTPADAIKGKVVIIGADFAKMPTVDTPAGKIGIHRAMNLQLLALYAHFSQ
jgi:adenylate cyclase